MRRVSSNLEELDKEVLPPKYFSIVEDDATGSTRTPRDGDQARVPSEEQQSCIGDKELLHHINSPPGLPLQRIIPKCPVSDMAASDPIDVAI